MALYNHFSNPHFLPVFSLDDMRLLRKLDNLSGNYGILAPVSCSDNLLFKIREKGKLFFIDSGIFENKAFPWHQQVYCEFINNRWVRELRLASDNDLLQKVQDYLNRCDCFNPNYVFAPDIFGEPLLSLHLARISWNEYWQKPRTYTLIGVVQVGAALYNWPTKPIPQLDSFPPHYESSKSFLSSLISVYREIGYQHIALGGLLKPDPTMNTGYRFGVSPVELDELLRWSRPEFVLGGLALTRLEVLKKHKVWADTTGWLWWNALYDNRRFKNRDAFQEVLT